MTVRALWGILERFLGTLNALEYSSAESGDVVLNVRYLALELRSLRDQGVNTSALGLEVVAQQLEMLQERLCG